MKNKLYLLLSFLILFSVSCENGGDSNLMTAPTGKGGSMARFALSKNYLYVVDNTSIQVYSLDANGATQFVNKVSVGFGVETIFAQNDDLFLGANDAMYIYSIADPATPQFVSRYQHLMACDPVVVNENLAYVTLRIRDNCRLAGEDALEIIDVSNKLQPRLIKTYSVQTPYGLGIDGSTLFVCEGNNGLKIFNAQDPNQLTLLKHYKDIHAYDVIPNSGILILTGNDGIFQYDYSDPSEVTLLSHLSVE